MFVKKNLQRGNVILRQGETPKEVMFLQKGQVGYSFSWDINVKNKLNLSLHVDSKVKKSETFVILGVGEMIGEEAVFKNSPLPYTVTTETECDFFVLKTEQVQSLCNENKHIKETMIKKVQAKIEMVQRRMQPYQDIINKNNEQAKANTSEAILITQKNLQIHSLKANKNLKIRNFQQDKRGTKKNSNNTSKFEF